MKRTSFSYLLIPVLLAISSCARIHSQPQYQREENQDEDPAEIVPLTEELKEKLNLRGGRAKAFFVLMVNSVTFGDGTKYTDEKTITSVRTYLEALGEKIENFECSTKRRPDH